MNYCPKCGADTQGMSGHICNVIKYPTPKMPVTTTNPSTTDWEPDWDRQFFYGSTAIPGPGGRSAKDHITMDVIGNEAMKRHIRTLLSRKEEEVRKDEQERILACGHAHEMVHGFQSYGFIDEEKERTIFEDGFRDGRAMLMIDVMSKRDPRKPSK